MAIKSAGCAFPVNWPIPRAVEPHETSSIAVRSLTPRHKHSWQPFEEKLDVFEFAARCATEALPQRICCSGGEPVADANLRFLSAALIDGLQQLIRAEQSGISGFVREPTNRGDSRL